MSGIPVILVPKTLDDQIGECIEAMALQFDVDVDKPVKKR